MNPPITKSLLLNGCHPYITLACIISCLICTIVMIWGTLAMRSDMTRMGQMMTPIPSDDAMMRDHCKSMPEMTGCERFR